MKKYIISLSLVLVFVFYILMKQSGTSTPSTPPIAVSNPASTATPVEISPQTAMPGGPHGGSSGMPMSTNMTRYKDGQYTGIVADAYYGNVQVEALVQSGKIADVQFLAYPNDRGTSVQINTIAMPRLKSEAIQAQNANVDIVSGATQTSEAFVQSLASALQQAAS